MRVPIPSQGAASRARRLGVALAVVATVVTTGLIGCAATANSPAEKTGQSSKYGSLPTFLPTATFDSDRVLVGTPARPALTTEGDAVSTGAGGALVTVSGPEVPGEGLPYRAPTTTCTWTVTIRAGSRPLQVHSEDFSTIDHLGAVHQPTFVAGEPRPPTVIQPGEHATFELRTVMVAGEGLMRWAPDGTHIVAAWDFEVEND